jgi:hypothetical protein
MALHAIIGWSGQGKSADKIDLRPWLVFRRWAA